MYAIIETGGKQYKVTPGTTLRVEKLDATQETQVTFDRVLLIVGDDSSVVAGNPTIPGARVSGKVLEHGKGPKIRVFKFRHKSNYRKRYGHRQPFTKVTIESIEPGQAP